MKTIAVIGAGASGMLAALSAAEAGAHAVLFERQARIGRKLLATGNGRCNLTNTGAALAHYHGEDPAFVLPALAAFPPQEAVEYFRSLGLVCTEQYGGRVYPFSDAAGSVLDVLRYALDAAEVEVCPGESVRQIVPDGQGMLVKTEQGCRRADAAIVACGGRAGGRLGGVGDGYELLRSLGHSVTKLHSSLVPLFTDTDYPRSLKGVRAEAGVRLTLGEETVAESRGEVQFTEKGVSGPAVFDVSRAGASEGGVLHLDLLPGLGEKDVLALLLQRQRLSPEKENGALFAGILHSRLGLAAVKAASLRPSEPLGGRTGRELKMLAHTAKDFCLTITGADSLDNAQVTAGGVRTAEFDPGTLESRLAPGVYACGEVLDIDGDCGGYNLQWAWASGRLAGRSAAL